MTQALLHVEPRRGRLTKMPFIDVLVGLRLARWRERERWLPACMIAHARLATLKRKAGAPLPDQSFFLPLHLRTPDELRLALNNWQDLLTEQEQAAFLERHNAALAREGHERAMAQQN